MRDGWKVKSIPHSEAQIMRKVCRDVQIKPTLILLPINENDFQRKVNTADNARSDIFVE